MEARAPAPTNTADELRNRMRLRLAMTHSASRAHANGDGGQPEVSQLVWNSVLESLSTPAAPPAPGTAAVVAPPVAPPAPANAEPRHVDQAPLPAPVPVAEQAVREAALAAPLHTEPAVQADDEQRIIADLFTPASPTISPALPSVSSSTSTSTSTSPAFYDLPEAGRSISGQVAASGTLPTTMAPIAPAMPMLAQPTRTAPPARPAQAPRSFEPGPAHPTTSSSKKKKRHPFRTLLSLIVVLGLIGGAAFTGWYFLIRHKVTWSSDVKPLADITEKTLHRTFTKNVPIVTLSQPEYEVKLGIEALTQLYPDADGGHRALTAAGLSPTAPTASEVGHSLALVEPSFYRGADQTIYRIAGTTALDSNVMLRSLSLALIDASVHYSATWPSLTDSQRVGYLNLIEGLATNVVQAYEAVNPDSHASAVRERTARAQAAGVPVYSMPVYLAGLVGAYDEGGYTYPIVANPDPLKTLVAPLSDAPVFDLTRLGTSAVGSVAAPAAGQAQPAAPGAVDPAATTLPAPVTVAAAVTTLAPAAPGAPAPAGPAQVSAARVMGMQFWYEVLMPALGTDAARTAALLWNGDSTIVSTVNGQDCLTSNVLTATDADQASFVAALNTAAAARSAASNVRVESRPGDLVNVSMCSAPDAGPAPTTDILGLTLTIQAGSERLVGTELTQLGLPATQAAWACALQAYRLGSIPNWTKDSTDPAVTTAMTNVVSFCKGPA